MIVQMLRWIDLTHIMTDVKPVNISWLLRTSYSHYSYILIPRVVLRVIHAILHSVPNMSFGVWGFGFCVCELRKLPWEY